MIANKELNTLLFPAPQSLRLRAPGAALKGFADAALDLLYPPHCCSCAAPLQPGVNKSLCEKCAEKIRWITSDRCARCGDGVGLGLGVVPECPSCRTHPPRFVEASSAAAKYEEGPVRSMVLSIKFGRKVHVAHTVGDIIAKRIEATGLNVAGAILVPTPLARSGLRERGFNQAEEIARRVGWRLKLTVETRLLQKIRATAPQAKLSQEKRRENLTGAFACHPRIAKRYADCSVLLIDDVITTGATVSECARTLHAAGLGKVRAAAFARG